jgi:hypothetical protein
MRLPAPQRIALGIAAAVIVSSAGFTGYAYATGSDPISLIKRWIEGDKVKVEYQGRHFEYGKTHNYSDAAVTALAEANTVQGLAFQAINSLQVPRNGVEYVDVPPSDQSPHQYPFIATLTQVTSTEATLHKVYLWGDKMDPSHDLDETVVIPAGTLKYYLKGEPAAAAQGTLLMVFPNEALRHEISTNTVRRESLYFGFVLSHDLASFKDVASKGVSTADKNAPIFETSWGGLSNICGNNGADTCDVTKYSQPSNQGLFVTSSATMTGYNPDAIAYGEAVPINGAQPAGIISRNLAGTVTAIDDVSITIATSSGAHWKLAYSKAGQMAFKQRFGTSISKGDALVGIVLESVDNLNNRTIAHDHIMNLERLK